MTKNACVIVAAGRGSRMGDDQGPKQYRELAGKTVLQRTIEAFAKHPDIHAIQVVIHKDDADLYAQSVDRSEEKLLAPVIGGSTRQASCKCGVDALPEGIERVLIHDAARPFVSSDVIANTLGGIDGGICALPCVPIADTVKKITEEGLVAETISRDHLRAAQTPQGFLFSEIKSAHEHAVTHSSEEFTDDAAVAEYFGLKVRVVDGDRANFKITTKQDLEFAQEQISMTSSFVDVRTGSGYDVHTLGAGTEIILCGVSIPHDQALQGHSDADVGLHSLTDALLGTIGAGDIGDHFPPSDPKWKGAASDQFFIHAVNLVTKSGGTITNLDVTLICEAPKIGPHRLSMRERISQLAGIDLNRVSVKATTNEKIGFIGRGEGVAALANATVVFGDR